MRDKQDKKLTLILSSFLFLVFLISNVIRYFEIGSLSMVTVVCNVAALVLVVVSSRVYRRAKGRRMER
ncbi:MULTISPECIES: hypothetical protein [Paenibacillus]|nr:MULTISPECIES: hypothetical protein [Paenibacillus]MUG67312.1 hypothetical protein [Paenibacillus campinasensis]